MRENGSNEEIILDGEIIKSYVKITTEVMDSQHYFYLLHTVSHKGIYEGSFTTYKELHL